MVMRRINYGIVDGIIIIPSVDLRPDHHTALAIFAARFPAGSIHEHVTHRQICDRTCPRSHVEAEITDK